MIFKTKVVINVMYQQKFFMGNVNTKDRNEHKQKSHYF